MKYYINQETTMEEYLRDQPLVSSTITPRYNPDYEILADGRIFKHKHFDPKIFNPVLEKAFPLMVIVYLKNHQNQLDNIYQDYLKEVQDMDISDQQRYLDRSLPKNKERVLKAFKLFRYLEQSGDETLAKRLISPFPPLKKLVKPKIPSGVVAEINLDIRYFINHTKDSSTGMSLFVLLIWMDKYTTLFDQASLDFVEQEVVDCYLDLQYYAKELNIPKTKAKDRPHKWRNNQNLYEQPELPDFEDEYFTDLMNALNIDPLQLGLEKIPQEMHDIANLNANGNFFYYFSSLMLQLVKRAYEQDVTLVEDKQYDQLKQEIRNLNQQLDDFQKKYDHLHEKYQHSQKQLAKLPQLELKNHCLKQALTAQEEEAPQDKDLPKLDTAKVTVSDEMIQQFFDQDTTYLVGGNPTWGKQLTRYLPKAHWIDADKAKTQLATLNSAEKIVVNTAYLSHPVHYQLKELEAQLFYCDSHATNPTRCLRQLYEGMD